MVTKSSEVRGNRLGLTTSLVGLYVAVVAATLAVLAVMSVMGSREATPEAWVHAAIVGFFALLLPLRLRAARKRNDGALRAIWIIALVLLVVNAVEAAIPGLFPNWMRIEMVGIAVLMAAVVVSALRARR